MTEPSDDEYATRALKQAVTELHDELMWAIEDGLDQDGLQEVVSLWWANHGDVDYAYLVKSGRPNACHDCGRDTTPYDEDGRPVDAGWEWYMVEGPLWEAATRPEGPEAVRFLCVGCLERRLGRRLAPEDFADLPINEPSPLESPVLAARLGRPPGGDPADGQAS